MVKFLKAFMWTYIADNDRITIFSEKRLPMELKWMEQYRSFVEKLIQYGNVYAFLFRKQKSFGTKETFSALQIQTLEYILESENGDETMTEMAKRLGVSKATFSKNVKILMEKGLLEKFHCNGNKKNIYVKPTQKGRQTYEEYTKFIYELVFKDIFRIADTIAPEDREKFEELLSVFSERILWYKDADSDEASEGRVFTKVE